MYMLEQISSQPIIEMKTKKTINLQKMSECSLNIVFLCVFLLLFLFGIRKEI